MKCLVTGATGFIGSHVAELLKEQGHDVRLLVRSEKRLFPELREGYEVVVGDVTQSVDELRNATEGCDYVFHVAALIKGMKQAEFDAVNAHGSRKLAEAAMAGSGPPKRFLLVSSLAAIGPSPNLEQPRTEEHVATAAPVTFYGSSKLLGEKMLREMEPELPLTIVRPPAVYGPRDTGILEFYKFMSKGYSIQMGSKERWFSLIHGRDAARGIIEAAFSAATVGEDYFLTEAEPYSMTRTMEMLREVLKPSKNRKLAAPVFVAKLYARVNDILQIITRKPRLPNSDKMRELLPLYWVCRGDKAKRDFGFEPRIDPIEGMTQTAEFYIREGWIKVK